MTIKEVALSDLATFSEKQLFATAVADEHKYTLFGGSRGPGKSHWLRYYPLRLLLKWYGRQKLTGIRVMLACEDYPSLRERQIVKIQQEFPSWLGTYYQQKNEFVLHDDYGSGVIALRNLDDPSKYLSAEFAAMAIDEISRIPERTFHILRGSLRWPGIDDTKFIAASNPSANWIRDYWIEKRLPDNLQRDADQFAFVSGLPTDNPYLSESYWNMLDTLPGALREAWLEGNWYASIEGLVWADFTDANITDAEPDPERPFELAIDDGYIDPRAILFIQRQPGGDILVFDEIYHSKRLGDESIADIKEKCQSAPWAEGRTGWRLPELAAVSHEAVELRQLLRRADIPARNWMADKGGERKVRAEAIKLTRRLICDGKGHRALKIHRRCRNLLDEITAGYKLKEGRQGLEEQPEDGNDHACEALSGWCWLRMRRG